MLSQKQDLTNPTASQGFASKIAPTQKPVEIGFADDTNTQIINGLAEGDQVVARTINTTTTTATSASNANKTAIPGLTGGVRVNGGGGGFRPGN